MLIAIQDYYLYATIAFAVLVLVGTVFTFKNIQNNVPDAFVEWKAKRSGSPVVKVHWRSRKATTHIAEIEKIEKELGTPAWTVPGLGIKFKPSSADDIEFVQGNLACIHYYENMTEPIKIQQAVAFDQLKRFFSKIGISLDSIESLAFYVMSECEKGTPDQAIFNARINSADTRKYIEAFLNATKSYRYELNRLKNESGVFSFQTANRALDSVIALSSAHVSHYAEVIKAATLRQQEDKKHNLMLYAIIAFVLCIGGLVFIYGLKSIL